MMTEEKYAIFNNVVKEALSDGIITVEERALIFKVGKEIGLT